MPITGGKQWRAQPFSFTKLCYEVGGWLFATFTIVFLVWARPTGTVRDFVIWITGFATAALLVIIAQKFGWKLLSPELRAQIPYDESDAAKGAIHSYIDLWRWLTRRESM